MKGFNKYLIATATLVLVYLTVQLLKPKPTNWNATYLTEDKIPFGTYLLYTRLHDLFPAAKVKKTNKPIYNTLKENASGKSNYFIIGSDIRVDRSDYAEMVKYMEKGNHIFIAAAEISGVLADTLKINSTQNFKLSKNIQQGIKFTNPQLQKKGGYYYFNQGLAQQYFNKIDTGKAIVLGLSEQKKVNFIQYKFGKGALYIMPNPLLLTNYSLLKTWGSDYASKALSYLPDAETFLWDEYFSRPKTEDRSPLRVIFNNEPLKWAYYVSIFGLLAFVLFEIKRRQRIIPETEPLKNTSVEFVEVVGRVYYQKRDNRNIAEKKISYLLEYIRTKYRLKTVELDDSFKDSLSNLSEAAPVIEALLTSIKQIKKGQMVSDQQLIELNKLIEQFYKQDSSYGRGNF